MLRRINLCFHGIGAPGRDLEPGEADYWVVPDVLLATLDLVADRPDVGLSFDDGNASDVAVALPALLERGLQAGFYPVAGRLGQPGSVSAADLLGLVGAGMEVGTHGMWHRPWRGLTDTQMVEELETAREVITDAIGRKVTTVACPLGSYDRRVISKLGRLDYTHVYTSDRASADPSAWLQPRFSIRGSDTIETVRGLLARAPWRVELARRVRVAAKRWR